MPIFNLIIYIVMFVFAFVLLIDTWLKYMKEIKALDKKLEDDIIERENIEANLDTLYKLKFKKK